MDIEAVAHDTPEKIATIDIDPEAGVTPANVVEINTALNLTGPAAQDGETLFPTLYRAFIDKDMSMLEINPLIVMQNGRLRVLDAKVSFDGNALFRHPDVKDIIKLYGKEPANFCDVGGGASKEKVAAAFKIITADPAVQGILVNIFGGIMRCDIIAEGVVAAVKEVGLAVPLVVRLEGTNAELGKKILNESGLNITAADDLDDAAQKIVKAVG